MASKAVVDAVKARQAANWTAAPVYYPNVTFKPPAAFTPFVVCEFPVGMGERLTVANEGTHRENGTFRFVVHVKVGSSLDTALTLAEDLAAVFRSVRFAGVQTWAPSPPIAVGEDGAWYKVSFSVPYTYFITPPRPASDEPTAPEGFALVTHNGDYVTDSSGNHYITTEAL